MQQTWPRQAVAVDVDVPIIDVPAALPKEGPSQLVTMVFPPQHVRETWCATCDQTLRTEVGARRHSSRGHDVLRTLAWLVQ